MNARRNSARRVQEAAAGQNQSPSQALVAAEQVLGNPDGSSDGEVRNVLLQMEQDITTQAQAITAQAAREDAPKENPNASTKARRLKDYTGMNSTFYYWSKASEYTLEFLDEVHLILCAMGVNEEEKVQLTHINSRMWKIFGTGCGLMPELEEMLP